MNFKKIRFLILFPLISFSSASVPIVLNTWAFTEATEAVWSAMQEKSISAVDAIVIAGTTCEENQCDLAVGYGGNPDETGETTLDAMIFDGSTMDMGAVGGLRRIKNAIGVARHVLENTEHSFLVGDSATKFAKTFKFTEESLMTNDSLNLWEEWRKNNCQPNFWQNVEPDPDKSCGPYTEKNSSNEINAKKWREFASSNNHDTIGIISVDENGNVAAGTSTNGLNHKIPGRVGDSPIAGAGAYADNEVGAAVATGNGDIMMRFVPSFLAVEELRRGATPTEAAQTAIKRIAQKYPDFFGAILVSTNKGEFGAACNGMVSFPFAVASADLGGVVLENVTCNL